MTPRRRRILLIALAIVALTLIAAPAAAFASAGSGSSGFSGGGGGGGGNGFALFIIFELLIRIAVIGHGLGALFLVACGLLYLFVTKLLPKLADWWAQRSAEAASHRRGRPSQRERRVQLASAEAADEDPEYAADRIVESATKLFAEIQHAWDAGDRRQLGTLATPDLMVEWDRRLDDFDRRGWRNHVQILGHPKVELVGLTHKGDPATDNVVVRLDARMKDFVIDRFGRHLKRSGRLGETTRIREFWTLQRPHGRWILASIEDGKEGKHALDEQIVATPWADERGLRDQALVEGAVADAVPADTKIAEVADLQYEGDAHAAALDLSLADGRFAPDVLEVAARRAVDGWARAIDGDDGALRTVATAEATRELLYAGDTSGRIRVVVRGPVVNRIRVVHLDAGAEPPTMTIEVDLTGRRYIQNRDTAAVLAGSQTRKTSFTERWTLSLTGDQAQPWLITSVASPVGLA
ncbi:MAG: Tim44-like domain-containing protein [Solirubrobacteraceae bacterium]